MDQALDLSVVIITLDEEHHLPRCLQSLPKGVEVIVLDSGSRDGTVAAARRFGGRVETRAFDNHAAQKNAALALATRSWVLSIDADEEMTPALCERVAQIVRQNAQQWSGYRVRRRLVFMGRRMRFGKTVDAPVRLVRRGSAAFASEIHERLEVQGAVSLVTDELLHYSYDDLSDYFERFNRYTSRIAQNHKTQGRRMPPMIVHALRPWFDFFGRYVLRLGFLDGYPGYCYALLSGVYGFVKYAKLRELSR